MRFSNIERLANNNTIGSIIENNMLKQGGILTVAQAKKVYDTLSNGESKNTTTNVKNALRRFADPLVLITNENNRQTMLYIHKGLNASFKAQNNLTVPVLRCNRLLNQVILFGFNNEKDNTQVRRTVKRNIKKSSNKVK